MKILALCALPLAAAAANAQITATTAIGLPLTQGGSIGQRHPPTLPLRTPVRPPTLSPSRREPPRNVRYIPAPLPYYYYPQQQPDQNVTVNVTNVIEPAQPSITYIAPTVVPTLSGLKWWDPVADMEAERAARAENAFNALDPDRAHSGPADADDVKTVEAVIGALYDVLSGPRGTPRNWERFRTLFADGARVISTSAQPGAPARPIVLSADEYAQFAAPVLERGVFEKEVARTIEKYGSIAHVFSTYECRRSMNDASPYQRGINSIQLMNDGTRWWITAMTWDAERAGNPIPAKYLPAPAKASTGAVKK
jgi:hypothetical protein